MVLQSKMQSKKDEIVLAATRLFRENGYDAASMREIANAAGLTEGSLYHYFASKEELLYEVTNRGLNHLLVLARQVFNSSLPPVAKLREFVKIQVEHLANHDAAAVIVSTQERKRLSRDHTTEHLAKRNAYENMVREVIRQGIEAGEFRPVDPQVATWAIMGMCNWLPQWYNPQGEIHSSTLGEEFASLIINGLQSKGCNQKK